MSRTLRQMLPGIYHPILPAFFDTLAPEESKATCASCAMCPPAGGAVEGAVYFRPDLKCCTYHPRLPNYLVGAILADEGAEMAEGRRRVRAQIEGRIGVSPRWLAPSRRYSLLLKASRESSFGRSTALRCPYFIEEGGLCAIWRHRESDCSTFFCKHDHGADGKAFWSELDGYLRQIERRLGALALEGLDPDLGEPPGPTGQLTLEELEGRAPAPAEYRSFWGAWEGREEELYLRCHARVTALAPSEVDALVSSVARELAQVVESHERLVAPVLPERLRMNPDASLTKATGGVLAVTFSRYEPVLLSDDLHEVLKELREEETVADFRARLLCEHGVDVPEAMLLGLHQLRVIISA
jgi:Fe-S-cluster containining protein